MISQTKGKHERVHLKDVCSLKSTNISDPYEVFGFGILAYFTTLRGLMIAMAFMTVAYLPVMRIYGNENFLN